MTTTDMEIYDPAPEHGGSDYILQFKIKNGPLLRAMRMRGYQSVKRFCEAHKLPYSTICRYFALTEAPLTRSGKWCPSVLKLAHALRLPPEFLFPEQHLDKALKKAHGELEFSGEDIRDRIMSDAPSDPETLLIESETTLKLRDLLHRKLGAKEYRVLSERFGLDDGRERSLVEIGEEFGVSRTRINQIEAKALRKLRHPRITRELTAITGYEHQPLTHYVPQWKRDEEAAEIAELAQQDENKRKADEAKAAAKAEADEAKAAAKAEALRAKFDSAAETLKADIHAVMLGTAPKVWSVDDLMQATDCNDRDLMIEACEKLVRDRKLISRGGPP